MSEPVAPAQGATLSEPDPSGDEGGNPDPIALVLAFLLYALLVEAAVETFAAGSPVRWWVTNAGPGIPEVRSARCIRRLRERGGSIQTREQVTHTPSTQERLLRRRGARDRGLRARRVP